MITNHPEPPVTAPESPGITTSKPQRYAGIDYGHRRIGLALADPRGQIASPAGTLDGQGRTPADAAHVAQWAAQHGVSACVVGLPLNMDGTDSAQTRLTRAFAAALRDTGQHVELWDERLSSFQADERLAQLDDAHGRRRRRARRDPRRDALAAQIILQSFLDARRQPT